MCCSECYSCEFNRDWFKRRGWLYFVPLFLGLKFSLVNHPSNCCLTCNLRFWICHAVLLLCLWVCCTFPPMVLLMCVCVWLSMSILQRCTLWEMSQGCGAQTMSLPWTDWEVETEPRPGSLGFLFESCHIPSDARVFLLQGSQQRCSVNSRSPCTQRLENTAGLLNWSTPRSKEWVEASNNRPSPPPAL